MKDNQKNKVYAWENKAIKPHDGSWLYLNEIQNIVDYVWLIEGLEFPPQVGSLPKNAKRKIGDATRLDIRFHEDACTQTWVVLHEIAHSITSNFNGASDRHGPNFVGVYIRMASKYLNIPLSNLICSARKSKVKYNLGAEYMLA